MYNVYYTDIRIYYSYILVWQIKIRCFVENKIPTQMNALTLQKYKAAVKG